MVNRSALWRNPGKFEFPRKLITIITGFNTDSWPRVINGRGATEDLEISNGIRQG